MTSAASASLPAEGLPAGSADPWVAFGMAVLDAAEALADHAHRPRRFYRFGPLPIAVEVLGDDAYERRLLRALQAAPSDGSGAGYRIIAIDGAAPGCGLVQHLAPRPAGLDLAVLHHVAGAGLTIRYHPELGTWRVLSRPRRLAVSWAADAQAVPDWEDGFPFRDIIHWMSFGTSWSMVHAAALGRGGRGLLVAGAGGSGKSTTTAAAVLAGLDTVGDDFVLVEQPFAADARPSAHLVYDCLRFDEASLAMLPDYRGAVSNPNRSAGQKSQTHLTDLLPERLVRTLALEAIVVPRVTGSGTTRLVPAAGATALKAILPSTAFLLSGGGPELAAKLAGLSRRLPVFALEIGGSPREAAAALDVLLGEG